MYFQNVVLISTNKNKDNRKCSLIVLKASKQKVRLVVLGSENTLWLRCVSDLSNGNSKGFVKVNDAKICGASLEVII
jgi:hypothetical protein